MSKQQLHRRLSGEQVKFILNKYLIGEIKAGSAIAKLGIGRTRFYQLVAKCESDRANFNIDYGRKSPTRKISSEIEKNILAELEFEKVHIIEKRGVPTKRYNYSYIKNLLQGKYGQKVSLDTIIDRAKDNGYYLGKPPKKIHDRQVLSHYAGELIQHDSSHHLFAPDAGIKWYLITSLDDYSRKLLYGDLWEEETSFKHILAAQEVILHYGVPFSYYVDQHSIFRYVKDRDSKSYWVNYTKFTDDADPQWKQVMKDLKIEIIYALSPQAKGKIERPYQWLQDHLVRTCVREGIKKIDQAREVLKNEINRYNYRQVHSTTKEIPAIRFDRAIREKQSLFREFKLEPPFRSAKDIFCLREQRTVNGYRQIKFHKKLFNLANALPGQTIDLKIYPDPRSGITEIGFWHQSKFLDRQKLKISDLNNVHF